jgi:pimeloyl-ACP methyl ester carboxylesterase
LHLILLRLATRVIASGLLCIPGVAFLQPVMPSVYEQFDQARREVVVFVHGVTGNSRDTWTNDQTKAYWPALIRTDPNFSSANVWVFSFDSPRTGAAQRVDEIATKLADELISQDVLKNHDRIYFLTHSMGGLIVRELLTQIQLPASKVPLIYFFGAPSAGADLAGLVAVASTNPQFHNLKPFTRESDVAAFAKRWLATAENPSTRYPQRIWSFCAYEIEGILPGKLIVSQQSATYLCNTNPRASLANHSSMVKPANRQSEPYKYFAAAWKYVRSTDGRLLASTGGLRLHSPEMPGIDPEQIKVRFTTIPRSNFAVGCEETRDGSIAIPLIFNRNERILAVQPGVTFAKDINLTIDPMVVIAGDTARVEYTASGDGPKTAFGRTTCAEGTADVRLRYVIESLK